MESAATTLSATPTVPGLQAVRLPLGLLGLERIKEYVLLADPAEEPFLWLQARNDASLAFVVLPPHLLFPDYRPDISPQDAEYLGAQSADDLSLLCIVTVRGGGQATINLKGPVVMNRKTWLAKQVIPDNAARFSVQHPLPVA